MDIYSVKKVPPNVANDVRNISGGGKKLDHPYYKVEERKGTGKATCRQCGEMIAEGDKTVFFHYAPDDDNTWIRNRGTIHADDCAGGKDEWTKCPKCRKQVTRDDWPGHWKNHKGDKKAAARAYAASSNSVINSTGANVSITYSNVPSSYTVSGSNIIFTTPIKVTKRFKPDDYEEAKLLLDWTVKGFAAPALQKTAASAASEDKARRDALMESTPPEDLPSIHGEPALALPDGYKVTPIKTLGDANYEGKMMSHCLGNDQIHGMFRNHHGMSEDDWSGDFGFPPPPSEDIIKEHYTAVSDEMIEHITSRGESRLMSLRDHNNIPRATWWEPKDSLPGTEIREVCGFANGRAKPKYEHRIRQYLRNSLEQHEMSEGKFEHVGNVKEGAENETAMEYEPVQSLHVNDLPDLDQEYEGQQYSEPVEHKTAGEVVPFDKVDVPVPGSIPKSLRDRFMDKLGPKDEEIDLPLDKVDTKPDIESPFVPHRRASAYPKNEDEMREHMRGDHAMDEDADKFPDVALGVIHDSDHADQDYKHTHEDLDALDKEFDTPEVNRDLSEMKGKELGENLWQGIKDIMGEPPTHCPSCGTHETNSQGQKTDEDGWDYEGMKCDSCGTEFGKDEAGSGMNFTLTTPQVYYDEWRKTDRKANFKGNCFGCGKKTFAFEDGENDPRGPLGDHAASPLHAEDAYKKGEDVPLCFGCANDYDSYNKASEYGNKIWDRDPEAESERDRQQAEWEQSRKQGWKTAQDMPLKDTCSNCGKDIRADHNGFWTHDGGGSLCPTPPNGAYPTKVVYLSEGEDTSPVAEVGWKRTIHSQKQADTSTEAENESPEATVHPAPMGYKPRVDPYADDARKKAEEKSLNDEVGKLQKNLKTIDQFAGSWKSVAHGPNPTELADHIEADESKFEKLKDNVEGDDKDMVQELIDDDTELKAELRKKAGWASIERVAV